MSTSLRLPFLFLCMFSLLSVNSYAEKTMRKVKDFYIVEMTVFTNLAKANRNEELWPYDIDVSLDNSNALYIADIPLLKAYPELKKQNKANTTANKVAKASANIKQKEQALNEQTQFLPELNESYSHHGEALKKLKISGRYRVKYHKVWLQKMAPRGKSRPIIFTAGEKKEGVTQIQGEIDIYKERYLHLNSKLIYTLYGKEGAELETNTTVANLESTEEPSSTADVVAAADAEDDENADLQEEQPKEEPQWPMLTELLIPEYNSAKGDDEDADKDSAEQNESDESLEQTLPIELMAVLKQKRRMRSKEIHYIDHPLMGILIEMRPFEIEVKESVKNDRTDGRTAQAKP